MLKLQHFKTRVLHLLEQVASLIVWFDRESFQ